MSDKAIRVKNLTDIFLETSMTSSSFINVLVHRPGVKLATALCTASLLMFSPYVQADEPNPTINADAPVVAFAAGDIADCRSKKSTARNVATAKIISQAIEDNPNAIVLTLGDHTYPVGTTEEFDDCYQPSWGQFKDHTFPSPGNHEYYTPNAYPYFQYFGDITGTQKHSFYSFDKGAWHIISLNSNLRSDDMQQQLDWLKNDLKNKSAACILAYWHHPVYSSGMHGNNSQMKPAWELLMAAKADVILSGHDHHFERFALQNSEADEDKASGIRQFIVGTGGATLGPVFFRKSNSQTINTKENGVLKLTLKKDSYDWEFVGVPDTSFTDQGSTACHTK